MPRLPHRLAALALAGLVVVLAFAVARPWLVEGGSMEPQVPDGSVVVVDDLGPAVAGYHRGDIVVLSTPPNAPDVALPFMLKRVVGVPGDHITIAGGRVFVNGSPLVEPYLAASAAAASAPADGVDVVVPRGDVFVLGDNRGHSRDSKAFGPIPLGALRGRVWLIVGDGRLAAPTGLPAAEAAPAE